MDRHLDHCMGYKRFDSNVIVIYLRFWASTAARNSNAHAPLCFVTKDDASTRPQSTPTLYPCFTDLSDGCCEISDQLSVWSHVPSTLSLHRLTPDHIFQY